MATRRQPAISGASPAGLKIKLRPGVSAVKASKGSQQEESGEDVGADSGEDSVLNEGMLKRKRTSPPASHTPNKKPAREESPVLLGLNGEPMEVVSGKSERVAGDLNVVKQRVGQSHKSVEAVVQSEQAVLLGPDSDYEEIKKNIPKLENISYGQLLVNSVTTGENFEVFIPGRRAGTDPAQFVHQLQLKPTGLQLSSGTPSSRTIDGIAEQHIIPSHAGNMLKPLNDPLLKSLSLGLVRGDT